jgi:hypothetical protein
MGRVEGETCISSTPAKAVKRKRDYSAAFGIHKTGGRQT